MAHHHRAPNPSQIESKGSSRGVEKADQDAIRQEKGKSFLDFQIAGMPWQFFVLIMLIAVAVLGLVLRVVGLF